jgi:hypothetical protein
MKARAAVDYALTLCMAGIAVMLADFLWVLW